MATKRPSYLKRQKEIKRVTRALEKREARQRKKEPGEEEFFGDPVREIKIIDDPSEPTSAT